MLRNGISNSRIRRKRLAMNRRKLQGCASGTGTWSGLYSDMAVRASTWMLCGGGGISTSSLGSTRYHIAHAPQSNADRVAGRGSGRSAATRACRSNGNVGPLLGRRQIGEIGERNAHGKCTATTPALIVTEC